MVDFIIALDSNPYSDEAPAVDLARVTAGGYDNPITQIEPLGDPKDFELIKSYLDEDEGMTVRQVVGLFGIRGMYREVDNRGTST